MSNYGDILRCWRDTEEKLETGENKEADLDHILKLVKEDCILVLHGNPHARNHIYYLLNFKNQDFVREKGQNNIKIEETANGLYVDGKFSHTKIIDNYIPNKFDRLIELQTTSKARFDEAMHKLKASDHS